MGRTWVARGSAARATVAAWIFGGVTLGCGATPARLVGSNGAARAHTTTAVASEAAEVFSFPEVTRSPLDVGELPPALAPFFAQCSLGDTALSHLAERFARRQAEDSPPLDVSEISFALRAEGSPYVWPRAWTLEGVDLDDAGPVVERMRGWLRSFNDGGERRCGLAFATTREHQVLAAVAVDALADLDPLPVRARVGSWLDVSAKVLVPTSDAKVIVLGPSGAPYPVPTSFDGQRARARFHVDRPGAFLIQLLATVAGGPRPVLEATVYADAPPPTSYFSDPAPGEPAPPFPPNTDNAAALLTMLNHARQSEQSPPLERDPALDEIAERHAAAMRKHGRVAHDAGDGDPRSRVEAAGLDVLATGENVAHALDVTRAHRALWNSPSHRENLLQPRFDRVGIGVAPDVDGSLWVCEVFTDVPDQVRPTR